jgi:uncharacterized protein YjbI with pentapeptide repeats
MPAPLDPTFAAHGTLPFLDGAGNLHVAVIVKLTYALRHGRLAEPAPPLPIGDDVYRDAGPEGRPRSLYAASDRVPLKPRADVVVVGDVHPRRAGAVRQVVGVSVARGPDVLLQKRLVALGDRAEEGAPPAPIAAMPLAWERARGGGDNPSGALLPNLIDPESPRRAAGLGPIAPTWPARIRLLTEAHAAGLASDPPVVADDLDLRFFQSAPDDQRIPHLRGGEQILLVGLHPDHPVFHGRLPALHAHARLEGPGAPGREVPLASDTLWIDATRGLACVTFRGAVEVAARAEARAALAAARAWTVRAGAAPAANVEEVAGAPRAWSLPARPEEGPPSPTVDPLAVHNRSDLAVGSFGWSFEPPVRRRVIVVKGTFALSPEGGRPALSPDQDPVRADEPASPGADAEILHASDFVPFKAQADVLLRGTAHAPAGRTSALVQIQLGALAARLVALGPRTWDASGIPSPPGPFEPVPLRYEHAFGGPGHPPNPAGSGFVAGTPPPRLEDPDRLLRTRADRPPPACFGPIAPGWAARRALLGSYDRSWQEERWPYFPADFDPAFFQAAPPRLRCDHLRGDEPFRLDGVRPDGGSFTGALPGVRPRVLAVRRDGDAFEVVMRLDTVVFDTDAGRLLLTWRGSFEVEARRDEIDHVVVLREDLDAPEPAAHLAARLTAALDPLLAPDPAAPERRDAAREEDPVRFGALRRAAIGGVAAGAAAGIFAARAAGAAPAPPKPPPPPSKAEIEGLLRDGKSLKGRDLSGVDLSGADLSGRDLAGAILARAKLAGARLAGASLAGANLADADAPDTSWDGADLSGADLTGANLSRARFVRARLANASLAGASLPEARLDEALAQSADLSGADLSRCQAEGAHLEKADLSGAVLAGASLCRARLDDAKLYETKAAGARFDEASLADARFEKAILAGASLRGAKAAGAVWERADLSQAVLRGADVTGAIFSGANLAGADLAGLLGRTATFRAADLSRALLGGADLMAASFEGARLDGAVLVGASLYQAELRGATLEGADTTNAILDGTKLQT